MSQVSRPMQIALAVTLLVGLAWFVALRPKPTRLSTAAAPATQEAPAAPGTDGLKGAVDKAKGAVATADGDAQRAAQSDAGAGATAATGDGTATARPDAARSTAARPAAARSTAARPAAARSTAARPAAAVAEHPARHRAATAHHPAVHAPATAVASVRAALRRHKPVAVAFVDPATADARAVQNELRHVSRFGGEAYAVAVPISRLSRYDFITRGVEVTVAPTVVIVAPNRTATTIVGFADRREIEQRLADALATPS